jgi:hypothetical protein
MLQLLRKILFNKYVWLILLPLSIGWILLADRLHTRTHKALYAQLDSVKQIWGGNLAQPMPSIRYKRFGSDVSSLSKGEIHAAEIIAVLKMDYRKKGLVYYTGYNAEFTGKYTLRNPENEKIYLSFVFPYPTKQGEGMLQNVKVLVAGQEDIENTEYQPNLALWTGLLDPAQALEITVRYNGRGLDQFQYGFEPGKQVNNFKMKIEVQGAKDLDYAEATMPPTEPIQDTPTGKILSWQLDRALTQFNIGVILPDKLDIEQQLAVMTYRAPAFFLLFLVSLSVVLLLAKERVNLIQVGIISVAYFLFYPLFAYLLMYLDLILAFALSFGIIGLLIFNYVRILHGVGIAFAILVAYTFYLGITSIAALLPTYTGLILTVEGVVLIGIIMQIMSRYKELRIETLWDWARPSTQVTSK